MTHTNTLDIPDPFAVGDPDPDPLNDALNLIQAELNICGRDVDLSDRYRVLQHLYGIVDHARRVLRGVGTGYQLEKARVIVDDAARLVAELTEQVEDAA